MKNYTRIAVFLLFFSANITMFAQDNHFIMWNANGISQTVNVPYEKDQTGDVITNVINVGDAAAVDLSTIAGIMKTTTIGEWIVRTLTYTFVASTNPNCLYFVDEDTEISDEMAKSLEGLNVVKGTTAGDIILTDGFPFFTPHDFTATTIRYERLFEKGNQQGVGGGWQTIVLPFDVQTVTADGKSLKWFANAYDDADFWVFRFTGDNDNTALFDFNDENKMSATTPYIVAVPNQSWAGSNSSLEGKSLAFCAENVLVSSAAPKTIESDNMRFIGTYAGSNELINAFVINDEGSFFTSNNTVEAFNAYIQKKNGMPADARISIFFNDGTETGLNGVRLKDTPRKYHSIYDLQGRRIGSSGHHSTSDGLAAPGKYSLDKGIYIIDGKKVVVR